METSESNNTIPFKIQDYLEDHKIPLELNKRMDILSKTIPFLETFMDSTTVTNLKSLQFISSRALANIAKLCLQLNEVGDTMKRIQSFIKDTIDDEVKNIAIAASKRTKEQCMKEKNKKRKVDYDSGKDDDSYLTSEEEEDDEDSEYTGSVEEDDEEEETGGTNSE